MFPGLEKNLKSCAVNGEAIDTIAASHLFRIISMVGVVAAFLFF